MDDGPKIRTDMIDFLKTYWDKLTGNDVIRSSDIIMALEQTFASFESNSGEVLNQMTVLLNESKDTKTYSNVAKEIGYNTSTSRRLLEQLEDEYDVIMNSISDLIKVSKKELPKMITVKTMTVKQSAIITLSEKLNMLAMTYPRFLLYILYKASGEKKMIYKVGYKEVIELSNAYHYEMMRLMRDNKTIFKDLPNLSDTLLSASPSEVRHMASSVDNAFPMGDNKFVTTWIYNVGKWWVETQILKLEQAKDEKRLIELKLLELREREETGNVSTSISKQIEYYEDKLSRLNKKIKDLSDVE